MSVGSALLLSCTFMICCDKFMPWQLLGPRSRPTPFRETGAHLLPVGSALINQTTTNLQAQVCEKIVNLLLWTSGIMRFLLHSIIAAVTDKHRDRGKHNNKIKSKRGAWPKEMVITYRMD